MTTGRKEERETRKGRAVRPILLSLSSFLLIAGCGAKQPPHAPVVVRTLAVLPLEPAGDGGETPLPSEAPAAVTAQIYRVLSDQTEFRFVPDLTVADTVALPDVRRAASLTDRAVALGRQVGADAVIFGRVFRYQKRVGTEYGASQPASVSFDLGLVAVSSGEVLWQDKFDETQEALASNLFDWWMFWSSGARWMSASELAGLGVEKLFGQMTAAVQTES